ncbi:hypothetical protein [Glycomyces xiaoerkulensis]|uniref:hypothetical protein n=1 Tax=Glycomyces xiaoerkulensis TaxID=2038139 RepID=UPI0012FFE67E|nr:hypothetical protein [Glycomyces xiaoerkulensis]
MTRAGMAAMILAAALASGCTSGAEPEPEPPVPTDDRMFGPDSEYETPTADLMTAASDRELAAVCDGLESAFDRRESDAERDSHSEEGTCTFNVHPGSDAVPAEELYTTGIGAALPVPVHVWTDGSGSRVGYFDPAQMVAAVDDADPGELGASLSEEVGAAVADAAGSAPEPGASADLTYTRIESDTAPLDLLEALEGTAEARGLALLGAGTYDSGGGGYDGGTLTYRAAGDGSQVYASDLYETSPAIGVADRFKLHVFTEASGDGSIAYFDPAPLFGAVGEDFTDAGYELSALLSDVGWEAAAAE